MASPRIFDHAILDPIELIACGDCCLSDQSQRRRRKQTGAVFVRDGPCPEIPDDFVNAIGCGSARDDAVVIVGESLRFHERLMAPGVAAVEIGMLRKTAGAVAHDETGGFSHRVSRAPGPVDHLLRMTDGERSVGAGVARVAARCGVPTPQPVRHRLVINCPNEGAVAYSFEFSVPGFRRRQPDFKIDDGIRSGMGNGGNPAICRQVRRRNRGRRLDGHVRNGEVGEIRARCSSRHRIYCEAEQERESAGTHFCA